MYFVCILETQCHKDNKLVDRVANVSATYKTIIFYIHIK